MPSDTYEQTGRSRALDVFRTSVGPTLLTISGPADSGKSVLLEELSRFESARDRTVISLNGRRIDSRAEILIGGEPGPPTAAEFELLPTHAAPTLLVDDAQWLDEDLARTVAVWAERRDELDLRVAVSHRTAALSGPLASLADDATNVALGPLPEEEVARWLAGSEHDAEQVYSATSGWTGLIAHHVMSGDAGSLVDARMGLLEGPARSLVEALAWGAPAGTDLLADLTGLDPVGIDAALDEAAEVGLLHDAPMPVPAIGQRLRQLTPESARVRVARAALDGRHRDPRGIAARLFEVGDQSDAASELYAWVGADLTPTDPSRALLWFERSGGRAQDGPARARALLYAGRSREALEVASGVDTPEAAEIVAAAWAHEGLTDATGLGAEAPAGSEVIEQALSTWLEGDPHRTLDQLTTSAHRLEIAGDATLWPDTPHATGALLASQLLDWVRAARFTEGSAGVGGQPFAARHNLATAWIALRRGRFADAAAALDLLTDATLTTRDALLAAALGLGLAVRVDEPELIPGRAAAALELQRVAAVSPAELEIHCEIALGVAKWQGSDTGVGLLAELEETVRRRAWPATSQAVVARTRLLIGLVGGDPSVVSDWGEPHDTLFGELSLKVAEAYDGTVDAGAVEDLVMRLREAGLPFEAARLAGVAALHTKDTQAARKLLRLSRDLREVRKRAASPAEGSDLIALSARELEVAREMLVGLTQKQIGEALYISPKTVEHHVAHIRQKLGSQSRAETMSLLRDYLAAMPD